MRVQIAQRQNLQLFKRLCTQVFHRAIGHSVIDRIHEPHAQRRCPRDRRRFGENTPYGGELHISFSGDKVDRSADQHRHIQRQRHHRDREQQRESKQGQIARERFENLTNHRPVRRVCLPQRFSAHTPPPPSQTAFRRSRGRPGSFAAAFRWCRFRQPPRRRAPRSDPPAAETTPVGRR
ncbi:hypothetical protein SDC9_84450 [bioreactor metagenome]|uniref:Uncharacterized protein n=1 Tax=bioreactor metagenome TaxID=1076179 RepID=A0A644ZD69_9ZZZZ